MTFLVERLADLRRHVDHLDDIRSRVTGPDALRSDMSLHNDVLFSLLAVCQLVIDIAGELSARHGLAFEDYTTAVRNLDRVPGFTPALVADLARLPGFRNVLIHDYVGIDMNRVVRALDELQPVRGFISIVAGIEAQTE